MHDGLGEPVTCGYTVADFWQTAKMTINLIVIEIYYVKKR